MDLKKIVEVICELTNSQTRSDVIGYLILPVITDDDVEMVNAVIRLLKQSGQAEARDLVEDGIFGPLAQTVFHRVCNKLGLGEELIFAEPKRPRYIADVEYDPAGHDLPAGEPSGVDSTDFDIVGASAAENEDFGGDQ